MGIFGEKSGDESLTSINRRLRAVIIITGCGLFTCAGCCFLTSILLNVRGFEGIEGATEVANRITDWTLPGEFVGVSGMTIDNALFRIDLAKFSQKEGRGELVVCQGHFHLMYGSSSAQQMEQMRENMIEKYVPELRKIDLADRENQTESIRGLPANFELSHGEDRASTTKLRQAKGHFRGKVDDVLLILQCEDGFITDEVVKEFLNSIR